jgi:ribosomal protein S12 methylthiotransferase
MRFHLVTLGCDKNTVDSERYVAELTAHGAQSTRNADEADLIIINTCGFIGTKEESLRPLSRPRFKSQATAVVAAVGCMVERRETPRLSPIDLFLGTRKPTDSSGKSRRAAVNDRRHWSRASLYAGICPCA